MFKNPSGREGLSLECAAVLGFELNPTSSLCEAEHSPKTSRPRREPGVTGQGRGIACHAGTSSNIHPFSAKKCILSPLVGTVQEEVGHSQETMVRSRAQEILPFI